MLGATLVLVSSSGLLLQPMYRAHAVGTPLIIKVGTTARTSRLCAETDADRIARLQAELAQRFELTQQSVQGHMDAAGIDELREVCDVLEE